MVDVFLCSFVDGCDGLFIAGIDALEGLAILAFDEFIVDEAVAIIVSVEFLVGFDFLMRGSSMTTAARRTTVAALSRLGLMRTERLTVQ